MVALSDRNYGAGDPTCPICGGLGYVRYEVPTEHEKFGRVFACECRRAQAEAERIAYLKRIGGLQQFETKTFDSFNPGRAGLSQTEQQSLRFAFERAQAFAHSPEGWLVLQGRYGCGKTHLATAIAHMVIARGDAAIFVTVPDLLDYLRAPFRSDDENTAGSYDRRFDEVRTVELLILDDLGTESPTPWAREKLFQIINHRYNLRLPTVFTTNLELDQMEERLRSRLRDMALSTTVTISAPDYRRDRGESEREGLNTLSLYSHLTFDTFELRRDIPREELTSFRAVVEAAQEFAAEPAGWLLFTGTYGSGKTHLAAAIANARAAQGQPALFISVPDLLDHLRAAYAPNSTQSYDKLFNEVRTAPLLVLDDLGVESATPWAREKLYQLFNHRYNARLATVITTSQRWEDLDPRLVTRLRDKRLCRALLIKAPAYQPERR